MLWDDIDLERRHSRLELISAPVWSVIAGGAAGLAVGLAGWKAVKHFRNK